MGDHLRRLMGKETAKEQREEALHLAEKDPAKEGDEMVEEVIVSSEGADRKILRRRKPEDKGPETELEVN